MLQTLFWLFQCSKNPRCILKKKSHSNICQVTMGSDMKWAIVYLRPHLKTSSESANAFQVGLFLLLMYLNNYLNENLMKFRYVFLKDHENMKQSFTFEATKGQLNSEWIYEVIVSPKMPTKNYRDFNPGILLEGRAEISVFFGWHFGINDELIKSFWI